MSGKKTTYRKAIEMRKIAYCIFSSIKYTILSEDGMLNPTEAIVYNFTHFYWHCMRCFFYLIHLFVLIVCSGKWHFMYVMYRQSIF